MKKKHTYKSLIVRFVTVSLIALLQLITSVLLVGWILFPEYFDWAQNNLPVFTEGSTLSLVFGVILFVAYQKFWVLVPITILSAITWWVLYRIPTILPGALENFKDIFDRRKISPAMHNGTFYLYGLPDELKKEALKESKKE